MRETEIIPTESTPLPVSPVGDGRESEAPSRPTLANRSVSSVFVMLRTARLAIPMALSYTFSFSIVAIGIMVAHLGSKEQDDAYYLEAVPLITTTLQTLTLSSASILYAMSIVGGKRLGELRRVKRETLLPDTENAFAENRASIRAVFRSGLVWSFLG